MRPLRLGPGPVFVYEWLVTTRRWQLYGTIIMIELSLVLLAAPAATAGAICLDKARGTLDHMLATDLSSAEIVLGKLGARLVPVLGLIACVLPVTALIALLGGIDAETLLGGFLSVLGSALLCCSLALVLSVWGRKTHEVLTLTYLIIVIWLLLPLLLPLGLWAVLGAQPAGPRRIDLLMQQIALCNPYYMIFLFQWSSGFTSVTVQFLFLAGCLAISAALITLATLRIRRVALRQSGTPAIAKKSRWSFPKRSNSTNNPKLLEASATSAPPRQFLWLGRNLGPSLDGNPVFWREWHMAQPTRMLRVARFLYSGLGLFWVLIAGKLWMQSQDSARSTIPTMVAFQVSLGLLLLSVSAATSLAEERVRGSLDVLLTTPMSTRSILIGKWWGSFRQIRSPLIWAALLSLPLLLFDALILNYLLMIAVVAAYGAAIASLGLDFATSVSRLGRAIALCVSVYLLASVIWILLISSTFKTAHDAIPLLVASPPIGTYWAVANISTRWLPSETTMLELASAQLLWVVAYLAIAALIFTKTVRTFDRHLGRMSETATQPKTPPTPAPILSPANSA